MCLSVDASIFTRPLSIEDAGGLHNTGLNLEVFLFSDPKRFKPDHLLGSICMIIVAV